MAALFYLVPTSIVLLALTQVQVTQSWVESSKNCSCGLNNVTLTMIDNGLQLVDPSVAASKMHHHLMVNVSRCIGGCAPTEPNKSKLVCRPTLTSLKTVMIPVHWLQS